MENKVKQTWCETCQRGHSNAPDCPEDRKWHVEPGDDCPICIQNVAAGRIGEDRIGKVWDLQEFLEYRRKKNEILKIELEKKKRKIVGIKGADIHRKEIEAGFKSKFDAQQAEIEGLKNLIAKTTENKSEPKKVEVVKNKVEVPIVKKKVELSKEERIKKIK